ncbi:hypothetical protein CWR48_10190 [Oceanobacillus arenosus]|uniref:Uncharacterized protein n=1 Tax=Oceanobacillus arenosus TaxID=1229153 RepID=A0A3D8PUS6_9BACI|nr:hypothetical protein [Oceanobacillus arenosus]RDW18685.1 hypothetical protein CWR48_10190 [Oceanobacillus arenosus]
MYYIGLNRFCLEEHLYVTILDVVKSRGWFTINGLRYTSEMEKAMHQTHHMSYAEYERNLDNRLMVEERREKDHHECKVLAAQVNSNIHM